jgi:hypothetical protein
MICRLNIDAAQSAQVSENWTRGASWIRRMTDCRRLATPRETTRDRRTVKYSKDVMGSPAVEQRIGGAALPG